METNTYILGAQDVITGEWGIHKHGVQLLIITRVHIDSFKVLNLKLNSYAHIHDMIVNESFTSETMVLKEQETT